MMSRIAEMRDEMGGAHPLAAKKVVSHLEPYVRAFIENAPFAVMATSDADGNCDASPRGGQPGFVRVIDERTLLIPDFGGNRLFQSFENFESNPRAGFVFMIPGMEVTARVNGRVEVLEKEDMVDRGIEVSTFFEDENTILVQGILLHVDEAYFHCPRSMKFANLWDQETIAANSDRSIASLKAD